MIWQTVFTKISIFFAIISSIGKHVDILQKIDFWPKFWFLNNVSTFSQNLKFSMFDQKFLFLRFDQNYFFEKPAKRQKTLQAVNFRVTKMKLQLTSNR